MIDLLLRSSVLIAAAWLFASLARKSGASAAVRHRIWALGIGAALLLPLLAAMLPVLPLPILAPESAAPAGAPAVEATGGGWSAFLIIYAAVAALLVARLLVARLALAHLWRKAAPPRDAAWAGMLAEARARLALERPVALRIADGAVMPMTWGSLRPAILLPAEALAWPEELRRIVLLHELAHVARRDSLIQCAASLVCALYWFQPALWFALGRLRIEQEYACDDLVLAAGARPRSYAKGLLDIAFTLRTPALAGGALAMARATALERRIRAIVGVVPRHRPSRLFSAAAGLLALLLASAVASIVPVNGADDAGAAMLPTPAAIAQPAVVPPLPAIRPAAASPEPARRGARRLPALRRTGLETPPALPQLRPIPPFPPQPRPLQPLRAIPALAPLPAIPALPPEPQAPPPP
jgi:beta-lactamase regulating signal transducer with metallopeptidase domain